MHGKIRRIVTFLMTAVMVATMGCHVAVRAEDTPGREVVPEQRVRHEKYVEDKQDGTYDLTLTVAGAVGSETSKAKLDVVYVLDRSGSMRRDMDRDAGESGERRDAAGDAINGLTNALAGNENLDVRFSLVTFSGSKEDERPWDDGDKTVDWTQQAGAIIAASKPQPDGGTNYQAGIREAKELLESRRAEAMTAVVFVSDGDPTYRYTRDGYTTGTGSSDWDGRCLEAAMEEVRSLSADYFFTVGVGPSGNYGKLRDLKNEADLVNELNRKFYEGTDKAALNAAFDDIQASITKLLCKNVTVTDALSQNVRLVTGADGAAKPFLLTVRDAGGNEVASGKNEVSVDGTTISARYDEQARTIVMDFPDDYELKEGYTYLVTANIEATEAAYEAYRANGNAYPDTGEAGTGTTSAGKPGVFTNQQAEVTYTYNEKVSIETYAKPVIQLHPGTLRIEKKITGLEKDADAMAALKEKLAFEYSLNEETARTVNFKDFVYDEKTGTFAYAIQGLSPDTEYKVSEKGGELFPAHAYNLKMTADGAEGAIAKDGTATALFQNAYSPSERLLTIEKQVTGNMGDKEQEFEFRLTVKKDGVEYAEPVSYIEGGAAVGNADVGAATWQQMTSEKGTYIFSLKDDECITVKLPYGCTYYIEENHLDYTVKVDGEETNVAVGTLVEDKKITYTNMKNVVTPTGVPQNVSPFLAMIAAAFAMAAGFLIWGVVWLKRRRLAELEDSMEISHDKFGLWQDDMDMKDGSFSSGQDEDGE